MTAATPASAARQEGVVRNGANHDRIASRAGDLALEVAFEAEIVIALLQHLLIDRSVHTMTTAAAFPDGFMFEDEWPALRDMAFDAEILLCEQGGATCAHGVPFMGVVAVDAGDFAFQDRVMIGKVELCALVQVALEAGLGSLAGIDDRFGSATDFDMDTAGAMTTFTSCGDGVSPGGH